MPIEVIMPKVDMDMASGKITTWHVSEGAHVNKGDPLFDIETDKAAMEVEAPGDGTLHHMMPEGEDVPIGKPVAWIYAEGEEVGEAPQDTETAPEPVADAPGEPEQATEPASVEVSEAVPSVVAADESATKQRATPLARSLAREFGLDLEAVPGTGPRGRIQADDIRGFRKQEQSPALAAPVAFSAENGPLHVSRSKTGAGTPIVFIHGFASDSTSWALIEAHLKYRPIIRIDLPGHGKSPKLRVENFAALVKQVRHAFDELHLEEAHLIGHSLGAAVALAIADTRERKIASLALISPAGLGPQINGEALRGICHASRAESLGPWLRSLVFDELLITDGYIRTVMASRQEPNLRAAQAAMADALFPDGVQAFDLRAALDRIASPTRIIWGKRDQIIPWSHALHAPGRVAMHLFQTVGHMPQIEAADDVGSLIRSNI